MNENKYENIIAKYSNTQLLYESAIKNDQYKTILAEKKALEEEFKRRLRNLQKAKKRRLVWKKKRMS